MPKRTDLKKILVIGSGPIGVSCGINARTYGAEVILADTNKSRRDFVAETFGFRVLDPLEEGYFGQLLQLTGHDLFDAVIDTTAVKISMENSWKYIANGGKIVKLRTKD